MYERCLFKKTDSFTSKKKNILGCEFCLKEYYIYIFYSQQNTLIL